MLVRVATWNLQGGRDPDLGEVADLLSGLEVDVVALQEIQRRQARTLAERTGMHVEWRYKQPSRGPSSGRAGDPVPLATQ